MEEEVITELNELIKMESQDSYEESVEVSGGLLTTDPACIMQQFETVSDLEVMQEESSEILQSNNLVFSDIAAENVESSLDETSQRNYPTEEIIVQLMDIRTRLSKLKTILENRTNADLTDYEFWLQDAKMLECHKTLVEQCIRGEGVVQVNIQLRPQQRRINIMDVLKPDEELVHLANDDETDNQSIEDSVPVEVPVEEPAEETPSVSPLVKWIVDAQFKADQERLRIPEDPALWTVPQVRLWIQWAVRQFNLSGIKLSDWSLSGDQLCALTLLEFKKKCPCDPGDVFWTHFELLRKCKFIAVIQNEDPNIQPPEQPQSAIKKKVKISTVHPKPSDDDSLIIDNDITVPSSAGSGRSGNNGQVQLWQFLLELLTSADHLSIIQWHGSDGEFKLSNPEVVARLWGARKHKPAMNYEKLSRALRYYYDGDMIAKVSGKRFVYKFVCDLKQLIGYDAGELSKLVYSVSQSDSKNIFEETLWT